MRKLVIAALILAVAAVAMAAVFVRLVIVGQPESIERPEFMMEG